MAQCFTAELLKLRKRPALWALCFGFLACVVLFGYVFNYQLVNTQRASAAAGQTESSTLAESILNSIVPEAVPYNVLLQVYTFGGAIALTIAALVAGSEYGWGTLKTVFVQRFGKITVFSGMVLSIAVLLFALALLSFAAAAASSYVIAGIEDAPRNWPALSTMFSALLAVWLVLATWSAFGVFLATLFRGTALAIGFGLVYSLALENLLWSLQPQGEIASAIQDVLLVQNASNLVDAFSVGVPSAGSAPDPAGAVLVMMAYLLSFLALSALILARRDVV